MAKQTKAERSAASKKAWRTRRAKYGKDGHKGPAKSKKKKK